MAIFHLSKVKVGVSSDAADNARMDYSNRDLSRNVWCHRLRGNSNDYYNARCRS